MDDTNYTVKYNERLVNVQIHIPSGVTYTTSEREMGAEILKDNAHNVDLRPVLAVYSLYNDLNRFIYLSDDSYKMKYKSLGSTTGPVSAFANFTYPRR